ncbi:MAG: DNA primase [Cycloclasticus sp.]|nr:DNA primase [Cycloclasticus sp.]MBQ0789302.1 DNA primase [Cycloclasticus sp.]
MSGRISQHFIDDLLARTDVVDVIDSLLPLKKKGANYSACCPFHNEKTPSFTVSQDKQFYHCFGCGVSGSAIGFLMDYSHLDFVEAVEELASRAGVEVIREQGVISDKPKRDLSPLLQMNEDASQFYQQQLRSHKTSQRASEYLQGRGLSGETAKTFQLGYAPTGWDNLMSALGKTEGSLADLRELGLIVSNDNKKTYDRFRERIMFPIRNKRGQTIGFGGRVMDDAEPKYLNSPETPLFHKGREVYGLFEALKASSKLQRLLLVEGYLDVISLHQQGITNSVAALGTAITREHIDLLFRSVSELVICMDGDSAGQKASWRAVVNALPALRSGRQIKVLSLPAGQDPDSLVGDNGAAYFEQLIDNATPLSTYFFDYLGNEHTLDSMEGRAAMLEQARPLLDTIPAGAFADMMKKQLANVSQLGGASPRGFSSARGVKTRRQSGKKSPSAIRHLITSVLHEPQLAGQIDLNEQWLTVDVPGMAVLKRVLLLAGDSGAVSSAILLERFRGDENERTIKALFAEEKLIEGELSEHEFLGAIERLKEQAKKSRLDALLAKSNDLNETERTELRELIK